MLGPVTEKRITEDGFRVYVGPWWALARPQVILTVYLSIVAGVCIVAARRSPRPWLVVPLGLIAGWVLWTIFEYILHRWLLHHTRTALLRRVFWEILHKEHHGYRKMKDPDHHGVAVPISLPMAGVVLLFAQHVDQAGRILAVTAGWLLGYCGYEALHWLFHGADPEGPMGRAPVIGALWRAHTVHHLVHAKSNYGFVSQFWDRRFGTAQALPDSFRDDIQGVSPTP